MSKILLIEDDIEINKMIKNYLEKDANTVDSEFNGVDGISRFISSQYDLVILDIMMPKLNGLEVIKIIRNASNIPILIISAKDKDHDKADGLDLGADDYISKPFSLIEFSSRIKALLRRCTMYNNISESEKISELEDNIIYKDLIIDLNNFRVSKKGKLLNLTSKEFEILRIFVKNQNRVFTKSKLYELVWNNNYYGDENVINVHIRRLRKKIEENPSQPEYIKTLWGIGYRLGER
jgi:DNA-binding response OmpR family regulator